jgi:hypothetical protein
MAIDEAKIATEEPEEPEKESLFYITPPYHALLCGWKGMPGLYQMYKSSVAQLCRSLLYSDNSVKLVKKRLRKLADNDYVLFDERPTEQYRSPYYYVLGTKGVEYVKSLGMSVSDYYRPSKEVGQGYLHLLHHAGVNDMLIAAAMLPHQVPSYSLERYLLERDLAHDRFNAMWHGKSYGTVPDLFLEFREALPDGRQRRTPILLEHDGASEGEETIRKKVHAYSAMLTSDWHKRRYGVNFITIAFTTFKGEKHRDKLRKWAMSELQGQSRKLISSFLFTAQQQPPDPLHIWLNPCWYTPFMEDKPVAILGG